jgi:ATP-dependent helicase HrpB
VRSASAIEPEWLLELYPDAIRETDEVLWNAADERVEVVGRLLYDDLVLDETRARATSGHDAERVLAEAAAGVGLDAFFDRVALDRYLARVAFTAAHVPGMPALGEEDAATALVELCRGISSFVELRAAAKGRGVAGLIAGLLAPEQSRLVASYAPETVSIAGRRGVRVEYERGKPPWIASRLQDFFGMREGPRVGGGRVAVVLHLLAPSRRPVQVTADLAGFWQRHYPQVRRELSRRYPRHKWPEDPLATG